MVVLTEILPGASSSSSSNDVHIYVYDVFLSFRGVDTRNGFTDHLYNSLLDAGFTTFLDDEEIETGKPLKPELEGAIRSSRASIIVLSKNYASSTWCLDELVLILEQHKNFNQIVIPVFYHVEPTDVRKQQNSFGEAMAKHSQRMEAETNSEKQNELAQKLESWKRALKQVADLKGKDAKGRKERVFIEEVVTEIHRRLGVLLSNTLPHLIGMDEHIRAIGQWLTGESCDNADILTIVGIGGIGKTSLTKYVFQSLYSNFDKSSFIEGINRRCNERFNGLLDLQKQLHEDMSKKLPLQVNDVSVYTTKIEKALARKKVFVVLDDIGSLKQLDALLGSKGLHPGSKVIITTKDASLTERCTLFSSQVQPKHNHILLNGLCESKSLELLWNHAFKSRKPKEDYRDVSEKLVEYCEGHPLALEVLGRSLQNQDVEYWEDCIKRLRKEPHPDIKNALKMNIDFLPSQNEKDLFKHIACFFVGMDRDISETILDACDINTRSGIMILIDRCLLSIGCNNELIMHQLIQEMGRDLVRQESPDKPWKRSRLWSHEESFNVLKKKQGKRNVLGLALDMRMLNKKKFHELETEALSKMEDLMLLQLNHVQLKGCFKSFPEELRWLCMHGSLLKSLPLDLPMENLVALDMSYCSIESFDMSCTNPQPPAKRQEWLTGSSSKDRPVLGSLKILNLSACEKLHTLGGFLEMPALERLIVKACISLVEVCDTVEHCLDLIYIDLSYCSKLKKVPTCISKFRKLKTLLLNGCNIQNSSSSLPCDLKLFTIYLPGSLNSLSLANNNLSNESFPMDFSCLSMLKKLRLTNNPIVSMPNCVRTLPRLEDLSMNDCTMLISIDYPPRTLTRLALLKSTPRKIKFDKDMSPLLWNSRPGSIVDAPLEIDGRVKIEAMICVDEKIQHSLGWTNLEFIKEGSMKLCPYGTGEFTRCGTQMFYEFGIFSTLYLGEGMPDWISYRSEGSLISFTIPSSPNNLRGLNFSYNIRSLDGSLDIELPKITISNITKKQTWMYKHFVHKVKSDENDSCGLLSHWMFGRNEMKAGDHIIIIVENDSAVYGQRITECGIGYVYEEDSKNKVEEEEDVLGYYKSWNYIIGGDLSCFQIPTGEYLLWGYKFETITILFFIQDEGLQATYKAFSQEKKSDEVTVLHQARRFMPAFYPELATRLMEQLRICEETGEQ